MESNSCEEKKLRKQSPPRLYDKNLEFRIVPEAVHSTRSATTVQNIAECTRLPSENAAAIRMDPIQAANLSFVSPNEIELAIWYFLVPLCVPFRY